MVQPGAVYVSSPSELGTIYSRAELAALREVCDEYGLCSSSTARGLATACIAENDLTLPFLAETADVFYIGGTKQGALFGEGRGHPQRGALKRDFRYQIKQRGGMLAKGRCWAYSSPSFCATGSTSSFPAARWRWR